MATWGVHFRIAEEMLKDMTGIDEKYFVIGSIGPDCGAPNEDWSIFNPPSTVTHWTEGSKRNIRAEEFYKTHIDGKKLDDKDRAYLIGYYVHLLTDLRWGNILFDKTQNHEAYQQYKVDKSFIWTIKEDWYDLDHKYFRDNPNNIFSRIFIGIDRFDEILGYYPTDATINQINYIKEFYLNPPSNLDREYIYMTEEEMGHFVDGSSLELLEILKDKGVL